MRLKEKVAIVTGGAHGMGAAEARLFAAEGATPTSWEVTPRRSPPIFAPTAARPWRRRSTAKTGLRLIVWCRGCGHQVEPDPAQLTQRYGAETPVLEWRERLVCSLCNSREIDFVVSGTARS
jgi:hypothetical protein